MGFAMEGELCLLGLVRSLLTVGTLAACHHVSRSAPQKAEFGLNAIEMEKIVLLTLICLVVQELLVLHLC